jgi:cyclopropane-fatty-acyl-phospholipid synthase
MGLNTIEERVENIRLQIHQPNGVVHRIGHTGPLIDWHLHTSRSLRTILKHPELNLGRSYVRGEWDVDTRQLPDLLRALISKQAKAQLLHNRPCLRQLRARLPHTHKVDTQPHWQDISAWVSSICLGEELLQGYALFNEPGVTLEQARRTHCRRLIFRLQLEPAQHLLDLNAGWGAVALFLAKTADVRVTAFVQTREQLQFAKNETRRCGLDGQVHFRLGSFHQCRGHFDRILATGFLERYPEPSYPVLFKRFEELLEDDGFACIQVTGRSKGTAISNRWYQRQLPAGYSLPLISDIATALESTRLRTLLLEEQTGHWLQDLETQAQRFYQHRTAISQRFGEQRTRHWEFQLASQATAVRWGQLRRYELLLGSPRCIWPAYDPDLDPSDEDLPWYIIDKISGLARDI